MGRRFSAGSCGSRAPAGQGWVSLFAIEPNLFVPYSRIGFWTCILAAVTVTALVVIRAMLADFGWSTLK